MNPYFLGICVGLFIGTITGFVMCAVWVISKQADKEMEKDRELYNREGKK